MRRHRNGWSRCARSMPAFSASPITRRDLPTGPAVMLMHGFPYDIHSLCRRRAATGGPRLPRHRSLFARLRPDPVSRSRDAALGRAGGGRRRHDGADGCAWHPPRGVRGLRLGWPRGLRRRGAMAGALHRARLRQFLSDPGYRQRHGAAAPRARGGAVVPVLLPARARPRRALPPTGARSPGYCGRNGRRTGRSTMPVSSELQWPTTIPTTSMW